MEYNWDDEWVSESEYIRRKEEVFSGDIRGVWEGDSYTYEELFEYLTPEEDRGASFDEGYTESSEATGFASWSVAYMSVLKPYADDDQMLWGLVYLDRDDIPELVCCSYMDDSLYSFDGGRLIRIQENDAPHLMSMIPGEGLFDIVYNGQPNERVRRLKNGKVSEVWAGWSDPGTGGSFGAPDHSYYTRYTSEEMYESAARACIGPSELKSLSEYATMSASEMEQYLRENDPGQ